jgi:uncharacterized protein YihD (DUF1040 family)
MRDKNRADEIDSVIDLLRAHWLANPDLPLGQILANISRDIFFVRDSSIASWLLKHTDPLSRIAANVRSSETEKL